MRRELQAQLEQNLAESRRREEEAQKFIADVASKLERLTQQLNEYRTVQEKDIVEGHERLSGDVDVRLKIQSSQMEKFSKSVQEARKESASNAETLQTLLVSIENLAANFQRLRTDMLPRDYPEQPMDTEEERIYNETAAHLL